MSAWKSGDIENISNKIKRVDTNAWETAQTGVEYYSPKQQGRIYGIVYRQYFTTSLPGDLTSGNNIVMLVDYNLSAHDGSNRYVLHGWSSDGSSGRSIELVGTSGNNNLIMAESGLFVGNVISGWVDYTK